MDFRFETYDKQFFQTHATVNYTVDEEFTRITEFKHLTGQRLEDRVTTIVKEYSKPYTGASGGVPYYAIINGENNVSTPSTKPRRTSTPPSTCWAGWPSTNTTTWTPSWAAPWPWRTN